MKKILALGTLFFATLAYGQTAAIPVYNCVQNGVQAVTSGSKSSNYLEGIIPYCTVTVYLTGTTTIATSTPQTPLQANSDGSIPPIYVATGGYDVKLSGGIYPNVYSTPVTITGVNVGGGGGTGCGSSSPCTIPEGGTGSPTLPGAQANLGINGATFNVRAYGAVGNGTTDDTDAIQAAFTACYNQANAGIGGVVEFPGPYTYKTTATINAYDGCQIVGTIASASQAGTPPTILPYLPTTGVIASITGFTVSNNCTTGGSGCTYSPAFPETTGGVGTQNRRAPMVVNFTSTNSFAAGTWVDIEGCTVYPYLNRILLQVTSSTGSTFTAVGADDLWLTGTYTDSCTATSKNVVFATDGNARYMQEIKSIAIGNSGNPFDVGYYFGSRIDTGTNIENVWVAGAQMYSYYFPTGGINVKFNGGWRSDGAQLGGIYWRGRSDSFEVGTGTVDNRSTASYSGPAIVLDSQSGCGQIWLNMHDVKVEVNTSIQSGEGVVTAYSCPTYTNPPQFFINMDTDWIAPGTTTTAGFNFTSVAVIPANSKSVQLTMTNMQFQSGIESNTTVPFVGIPSVSRNSIFIGTGNTPLMAVGNSNHSSGTNSNSSEISQIIGDLNLMQVYQYGVQSNLLNSSDYAFAALPSGTTLYAGMILAPGTDWSTGNYSVKPVTVTGTTGTLNAGATTCATPIFTITSVSVIGTTATFIGTTTNISTILVGNNYVFAGTGESWLNGTGVYPLTATATGFTATVASGHDGYTNNSDTGTASDHYNLICSSATDMDVAQRVSITGNANLEIQNINALNSSSVVVQMAGGIIPVSTASTLAYVAPTLGAEGVIPTITVSSSFNVIWGVDAASGDNSQVVTITTGSTPPTSHLACDLTLTSNQGSYEMSHWFLSGDTNGTMVLKQYAYSEGGAPVDANYLYLTAPTSSLGTVSFSIVNMSSSYNQAGKLAGTCYNTGSPVFNTVTVAAKTGPVTTVPAHWVNTPQFADATGTGGAVLKNSPTITGASINGVTLTTGGSNTTFLNGAGSYTTPSSGGSFTAGGDLSGTISSQTVIGLDGVPFCTGYTPTDGEAVTLTTASTPNPCYTATTPGGSPFITGLTTTGTYGPATVVSGTLNVPQYSSSFLTGANVVFNCDSGCFDDSGNTLGATITATASSCTSGGHCTVTASNGYVAGQWFQLNSGFNGGPNCSALPYYGTGNRVFQVLSTGLSSTQFEFQTKCLVATSGSGGTIEDATYFISIRTSDLLKSVLATANSWQFRNGLDLTNVYGGTTGMICDQSTNFTAMFGDLLPSVTGKPLYFLEESAGNNDVGQGQSAAQIEACFQSFWAQAHTAGAVVIQNTIPLYNGSFGTFEPTVNTVNAWLVLQGKSTSNAAIGQYWDWPGVNTGSFGETGNPFSSTYVAQMPPAWAGVVTAPGTGFVSFNCNSAANCAPIKNPIFTGSYLQTFGTLALGNYNTGEGYANWYGNGVSGGYYTRVWMPYNGGGLAIGQYAKLSAIDADMGYCSSGNINGTWLLSTSNAGIYRCTGYNAAAEWDLIAGGVPVFKQSTFVTAGTTGTTITSPAINVMTNDLLYVACQNGSSDGSATVTDSLGNIWNQEYDYNYGTMHLRPSWTIQKQYYPGSDTFTCTFSGSVSGAMIVLDYSGTGNSKNTFAANNGSGYSYGPSLTTSQKTLVINCTTTATAGYNGFLPGSIGGNPAQIRQVDYANASGSGADMACSDTTFTNAVTGFTAFGPFLGNPGDVNIYGQVDSTLAINY